MGIRDTVCFYIPIPGSQENPYLIEYIKARKDESDENISFPEFRRDNFMFEREVTANEVQYSRLMLSTQEVRNHFPGVRIPAETHDVERLCFTDPLNKEWWFKIIFYYETYLVIDGWEGFVNYWKVEGGDVIKFYKPVRPLSSRHFLITHVKKRDEIIETIAGNDQDGGDDRIVGQIPDVMAQMQAMTGQGGGGGGQRRKEKKCGVGCCTS